MNRKKKTGAAAPVKSFIRCIQHVLDKNPIPSRGIIHQHMRHRTHKFAVLNDQTSAHG